MNRESLTTAMEDAFCAITKGSDGSHDIGHARRVKALALDIATRESCGNEDYLIAAAYMHDIVNVPKNDPNRHLASAFSAEKAVPVLHAVGFDHDAIQQIQHIIIAHSFSAEVAPQTNDARIFQDADRLDALGAIGIARTFYVAGALGGLLFDGEDPFAQHRSLDDKTFALDHFATKILQLPDTMQTQRGREIALKRRQTVSLFLECIAEELGCSSPR